MSKPRPLFAPFPELPPEALKNMPTWQPPSAYEQFASLPPLANAEDQALREQVMNEYKPSKWKSMWSSKPKTSQNNTRTRTSTRTPKRKPTPAPAPVQEAYQYKPAPMSAPSGKWSKFSSALKYVGIKK